MNPFKLVKDRRNPLFFYELFNHKPINFRKGGSIFFTFTLDLERAQDNKFDQKQLERILNFLKGYGKGTIFVETSLLEEHSFSLDKHEVGSHGYRHLALGDDWWIKNNEKAKNRLGNIKKSNELIKDFFGRNPVSFRCPKFSKGNDINAILSQLGYRLDSSEVPHNNHGLPIMNNDLLEVPVSRYYRPSWRSKKCIPFLKYDSLMFSNLKSMGVQNFLSLSQKIVFSWPKKSMPLLNFMCHNWDFSTKKDFDLMGDYLDSLQNTFKVKFLSLNQYHDIVKS